MIERGNLHNNLYVLDAHDSSSSILSTLHSSSLASHKIITQHHTQDYSVSFVSSEVWHQRLGHPSKHKVQVLSKFLNIPYVKSDNSELCKIYPLAKQKQIYFPSNPHLSKAPFDLVHLDVWGPFQIPTHDGYKYFSH